TAHVPVVTAVRSTRLVPVDGLGRPLDRARFHVKREDGVDVVVRRTASDCGPAVRDTRDVSRIGRHAVVVPGANEQRSTRRSHHYIAAPDTTAGVAGRHGVRLPCDLAGGGVYCNDTATRLAARIARIRGNTLLERCDARVDETPAHSGRCRDERKKIIGW